MEPYQNLIGVVLEKMQLTYKELLFNLEGLNGVLEQHSDEEKRNIPELLTITQLRDTYAELVRTMEERYPGLRDV
ncbi:MULTISPECIES: hypothetical protein [Paenibacillus]|uniref:hypothetical protein n=1 Tax=Paenibacillus TaxID=44249 RepID=UPI0022B91337|nr:hypothetical protein [Paenibacillus caseinilyticus]MCZ8521233.1 hypothetical protein [Paenibacillus caseinilyticus]